MKCPICVRLLPKARGVALGVTVAASIGFGIAGDNHVDDEASRRVSTYNGPAVTMVSSVSSSSIGFSTSFSTT